jgi:MoxR-like ATPase
VTASKAKLDAIITSISSVLIGKEQEVRIALTCLLARGHLLIEDLPGLGKTTLVNAMARVLGLDFNRIQFTSDLLPADIVGVSVYEKTDGAFRFLPGPVFCQMLLADEINRTTPKTQSALLEAMAEGQVTVEGRTRDLPEPFFVVATQNPIQHSGTFPLPESQLDRFLMRVSLGYADQVSEKMILTGGDPRARVRCILRQIAAGPGSEGRSRVFGVALVAQQVVRPVQTDKAFGVAGFAVDLLRLCDGHCIIQR